MPFIPNTEEEKQQMLKDIGVEKFEELLVNVPEKLRLNRPLDLPEPLSELEVSQLLADIAEYLIRRDALDHLDARHLVLYYQVSDPDSKVVLFYIRIPECEQVQHKVFIDLACLYSFWGH